MGGGNRVRWRSAGNVIDEIRRLKALWGITAFRFQDDVFTINLPRLRELAALLQAEDISYRCFGRVEPVREREVTDLLFQSGCRHIAFGVESGSPMMLECMKKGQTGA